MWELDKEIGENIRHMRKLRRYTREELSIKLEQISGQEVTARMVGSWERADRDLPAPMLVFMAIAMECSVICLIHADRHHPPERLHTEIALLPDREREILTYAATEWMGNTHALIEFAGLYMALSPEDRSEIVHMGLTMYNQARTGNHTENTPYQVKERYITDQLRYLADY